MIWLDKKKENKKKWFVSNIYTNIEAENFEEAEKILRRISEMIKKNLETKVVVDPEPPKMSTFEENQYEYKVFTYISLSVLRSLEKQGWKDARINEPIILMRKIHNEKK